MSYPPTPLESLPVGDLMQCLAAVSLFGMKADLRTDFIRMVVRRVMLSPDWSVQTLSALLIARQGGQQCFPSDWFAPMHFLSQASSELFKLQDCPEDIDNVLKGVHDVLFVAHMFPTTVVLQMHDVFPVFAEHMIRLQFDPDVFPRMLCQQEVVVSAGRVAVVKPDCSQTLPSPSASNKPVTPRSTCRKPVACKKSVTPRSTCKKPASPAAASNYSPFAPAAAGSNYSPFAPAAAGSNYALSPFAPAAAGSNYALSPFAPAAAGSNYALSPFAPAAASNYSPVASSAAGSNYAPSPVAPPAGPNNAPSPVAPGGFNCASPPVAPGGATTGSGGAGAIPAPTNFFSSRPAPDSSVIAVAPTTPVRQSVAKPHVTPSGMSTTRVVSTPVKSASLVARGSPSVVSTPVKSAPLVARGSPSARGASSVRRSRVTGARRVEPQRVILNRNLIFPSQAPVDSLSSPAPVSAGWWTFPSAPVNTQSTFAAPVNTQSTFAAPVSAAWTFPSAPVNTQSTFAAPVSAAWTFPSAPVNTQSTFAAPVSAAWTSSPAPVSAAWTFPSAPVNTQSTFEAPVNTSSRSTHIPFSTWASIEASTMDDNIPVFGNLTAEQIEKIFSTDI